MKNKNTIIKIILVFIGIWLFLYANAVDVTLWIKEVKKDSENTLRVNFDTPMPESWLSGEMKVFKDLWVTGVKKDDTANNKITVTMWKDIKVWSTYNIFSVFGVEWSADFIVEDPLNVKIISQAPEAQGITKITLKDKKNVELEFKNPLSWTEFEFKLLEDLGVNEISSNSWSLMLKTSSTIENNSDYILILISLWDKANNNYTMSESIYDFNIWNDSIVKNNEDKKPDPKLNDLILNSAWPTPVKVEIKTWTWNLLTWTWNLLTWTVKNWSWSLWNIEKVAVKAKETPNTGPETWIVMLLTLIINSIYFLTRKFSH